MKDGSINDFAPFLKGEVRLKVFRGDGRIEEYGPFANLFVNEGMNYLAAFQSTTVTSVMNYMIVGSLSNAATLTDVATTMGEMDRNIMATRTSAANVLTEVATFAGGLDSLTNFAIREIGVINDARSGGFGSLRSRVGSQNVTLAASDFLSITYQTTVGSR